MSIGPNSIGIVVIGRNEGERLKARLRSVINAGPVVYVDSGSIDGSQDFARSLGVEVVTLAVPPNFTAARARNAGIERLLAMHPDIDLIQTVDGDCEVRADWIARAEAALAADPGLALVFGRRRERHPDRSIYNAQCDDEWNAPIGEAAGCGGDALIRVAALRAVKGYDSTMIAGEDSEMSMRMRKKGWRLARIEGEMTWHDAAILRFGQWWRRSQRAGHGFAEMAHRHPDARWPNWPRTCRSIIAWGGVIPALAAIALLLAIIASPWWLIVTAGLAALYPLKATRIAAGKRAQGLSRKVARGIGWLLMIGKVPEFVGLIGFHRDRLSGRASRIIEYKGAAA